MPEVELSAGTIEYEDTGGEGPVFVLLHGVGMDGSLWRHVVAELRPDFRCVVPTLPLGGHRRPMRFDANLSLRAMVRLVAVPVVVWIMPSRLFRGVRPEPGEEAGQDQGLAGGGAPALPGGVGENPVAFLARRQGEHGARRGDAHEIEPLGPPTRTTPRPGASPKSPGYRAVSSCPRDCETSLLPSSPAG